MKLTVLGKYGPFPAPGGATSGYLLEDGNTKMALDMGAGTLARLQSVTDIRELDAIYISHLHYDHTSDLLPFRYLLDTLGKTVDILTHTEDSEWCRVLLGSPLFNVINIDENTEMTLGEWHLSFAKMSHPAEDHAIKVRGGRTFVYTGDTVFCDALPGFVSDADAVLCGCAKPLDFKGPHMSGADGLRLADSMKGILYATHFAPGFDEKTLPARNNMIFTEEMKVYEI